MKKIFVGTGMIIVLACSFFNLNQYENRKSNNDDLIYLLSQAQAQSESFWDTYLYYEEWKECEISETEANGILGWLGITSIDTPVGGWEEETTTSTYPGQYSTCVDGDEFCWPNDCERA
ncbi:hypothetical protein [Flavisericum labens]|uniref:hypothetical protein n=1 Tax=Flavisericum labens TaxID=3377112 RepID=UPI00387AAAF2